MSKKVIAVGMTRYCKICEKRTTFWYRGIQIMPNYRLKLWDCGCCGGTQADKVKPMKLPRNKFPDTDLFLQGTGRL